MEAALLLDVRRLQNHQNQFNLAVEKGNMEVWYSQFRMFCMKKNLEYSKGNRRYAWRYKQTVTDLDFTTARSAAAPRPINT